MRSWLGAAVLGLLLAGCGQATVSVREGALRYVALGDSYTIGTSVSSAESWPSQLVARVPRLGLVANLGVNGYTSRDLISDELPALPGLQPEFVTLLIGVNDVVQGVPEGTYAANLEEILDAVLSIGAGGAGRVRGDARLHGHAAGLGLRVAGAATRGDRSQQRGAGSGLHCARHLVRA